MRYFVLSLSLFLAACAHEPKPVADNTPFDQRLAQFASLQNSGNYEALRSHFTKTASIQSPLTPQGTSADRYLRALAAEPYTLTFNNTETVYSFPGRAMTQSEAVATSPGRFSIRERVTVDWRLEDDYWRIARIIYGNWPAIIGTWKRSGLKNEGSIELRVMPGGTYVVYTAEDYSAPAFRGQYRLEGNKITFGDTSAWEAKQFQRGEGSYIFVRTPTGLTFRKVDEENTWRNERYEGVWSAGF